MPKATSEQPKALPSTPVATKSKHAIFYSRHSQEIEKHIVDMSESVAGEAGAQLELCFTYGYTGIDNPDNSEIARNVGSLSNRLRAECDAILRRQEQIDAAEKAREKVLDEAYDKQHGRVGAPAAQQP